MIDTHAHLDDKRLFEDRARIIENAKNEKVTDIICVGCDLLSSIQALEIAMENSRVFAAIGVHPHEAKTYSDETEAKFMELAKNKKVVAIGEIGLDFYYNFSAPDVQKTVFLKQLELADSLNLPIIIHTRDSQAETLQILKENKHLLNNGGVMHCFDGDETFAKETIQLGLLLGVGGTLTFKNSEKLRETIQNVPLDKLVLETDCPYLTPMPFRGKCVNEPKYISLVAGALAMLHNCDISKIDEITTKNAKRVFKI